MRLKAVMGNVDVAETWLPIATSGNKGLIDIWTVGWMGEPARVTNCYYDAICDEWRKVNSSGRLVCIKARFVTHWMARPKPPAAEGEVLRADHEQERSICR